MIFHKLKRPFQVDKNSDLLHKHFPSDPPPEVEKIFFFLSSRSIGTIFFAKFKKFEVRVMHIHLKKSNDLGFNQNILLQKRQYFPDFVC